MVEKVSMMNIRVYIYQEQNGDFFFCPFFKSTDLSSNKWSPCHCYLMIKNYDSTGVLHCKINNMCFILHMYVWHVSEMSVEAVGYALSLINKRDFTKFEMINKRIKNKVLEMQGIEPCTSRMQSERSTIWATSPSLKSC